MDVQCTKLLLSSEKKTVTEEEEHESHFLLKDCTINISLEYKYTGEDQKR